MSMTKQQEQIVGLQDVIDSLTGMKLHLQRQTGTSFSEVVTNYSSEGRQTPSAEGQNRGGTKQQLREARSRIDRLFATLEQ